MLNVLIINLSVIVGMMLVVWLVSLARRDASIIDLVWGLGFVIVVWVTIATVSSSGLSRWLLAGLTTIWGLRLSAYLAWRNHGQPEDRRYARMRKRWSAAFPLVSLFTVFLLQGVVMWVVSLPIQLGILESTSGFSTLHALGLLLWSIGLLFESIGDWQLARFKSDSENAGKVLDRGLWRYTRHPNYFGDFCVWWGLFLIALAGGAPWWTAIGPIVMSLFLMFISGVSLLESDLKDRKPQYAAYMRRTNAFFPGPTGNAD
jgi:steroid 5-alpha reductase family enzyme